MRARPRVFPRPETESPGTGRRKAQPLVRAAHATLASADILLFCAIQRLALPVAGLLWMTLERDDLHNPWSRWRDRRRGSVASSDCHDLVSEYVGVPWSNQPASEPAARPSRASLHQVRADQQVVCIRGGRWSAAAGRAASHSPHARIEWARRVQSAVLRNADVRVNRRGRKRDRHAVPTRRRRCDVLRIIDRLRGHARLYRRSDRQRTLILKHLGFGRTLFCTG